MSELQNMMNQVVSALVHARRSPILRTPEDEGLDYEDVKITALDGVELDAWFIPAESNKVIICNHFSPGNRYGYPGHLDEYNTSGGFEVNFIPKYKALHDAGYNVLTYDMRNHGTSQEANDGISTVGAYEWQDVVGSINYIRNREDTKDYRISLQSNCMGAEATFIALEKMPEAFESVEALVAAQPLSGEPMIQRMVDGAGMSPEMYDVAIEAYDKALREQTGFGVDRYDMPKIAHLVKIPTLLLQVKEDLMTKPFDMENIYANLGTEDKKLVWVEGTPMRFHGYTYFSEKPEEMIEWFNAHMK
ncbi:alpha/beta hydrolase [Anaeromicrobium sediminis]|uniref:Alpha/beta hydrolase n=1 Tax=Anaeromicrobium sediminis TaxID=1478221 RepID=A0A267MKH2_9FIRM|nr:alpha/beta hydrolase [Anaeromicrobium sediminis]